MPVVFLITIAAVLVGIFFAATGRGGEMAYEHADHAPLDLGPVSAADIALLRPPTALWGYSMQVTDEALDHIARAMRERDVTIVYLQEQLASYEGNGSYAEPKGAHARLAPEAPEAPLAPERQDFPEAPEYPQALQFAAAQEEPEPPDALGPLESPEPPLAAEPYPAPLRPQTPLVLKASGPKPPPAPEPHEPTQPSQTLQDREEEAQETTQPSATRPADETRGPQGAFDTHGWWAEQEQAARAEEQGW